MPGGEKDICAIPVRKDKHTSDSMGGFFRIDLSVDLWRQCSVIHKRHAVWNVPGTDGSGGVCQTVPVRHESILHSSVVYVYTVFRTDHHIYALPDLSESNKTSRNFTQISMAAYGSGGCSIHRDAGRTADFSQYRFLYDVFCVGDDGASGFWK